MIAKKAAFDREKQEREMKMVSCKSVKSLLPLRPLRPLRFIKPPQSHSLSLSSNSPG